MGKFFSRFNKDSVDASVSSLGNMANFYSLLIFLIAIPFVLIVALVWVTGILGFNAYIFAGFACLVAYVVWRFYRRWGVIKAKMAAQTGDFQDLMREATKNGKDVEISLMNGIFTLRYTGANRLTQATLPAGRPQPLALEAPAFLEAEAPNPQTWLPPERLREELEEFIRLRDEGVISPEEFDRIKASLLQRISA
ncbi:MAG: SHOCT domain-containing protein [Desulfobaccales bacterium]